MKASMLQISGRSSGQPQSNHWQKIIENLNVLLKVLQDNHGWKHADAGQGRPGGGAFFERPLCPGRGRRGSCQRCFYSGARTTWRRGCFREADETRKRTRCF